MLLFALYIAAVLGYILFLIWLLLPIFRWRSHDWNAKSGIKICLAILQLVGTKIPLAGPLIFISILADNAMESSQRTTVLTASGFYGAVTTFPTTLPAYIENIFGPRSKTATVVDVQYRYKVSDQSYAPIVRTICYTVKKVAPDKGLSLVQFDRYPVGVGGELVMKAGEGVVAFNHAFETCGHVSNKNFYREGQQKTFDSLLPVYTNDAGPAGYIDGDREVSKVDDITFLKPEIIRVETKILSNGIPQNRLWPWRTWNDRTMKPKLPNLDQ